MRKINLLIIVILMTISCGRLDTKGLLIRSDSDTVNYGDIYTAELYIPYRDGFLPAFFIIKSSDTLRLPIDTAKKCAVFKSVGRGSGERIYKGYVNYIDLNGKSKTETFSFKYYVRQ